MDKFFVLVNTLNEFRNLKFSFDEENQTYVTYDNPKTQLFGTPDILWSQIVFVADSSIIYTKGTIYTNYIKPDTGIPATDLEESIQTILSNAGAKITLADLKLSEKYEKSSYITASDLVLNVGDLYDTAFGKIEKKLDDNITYLNDSYIFLRNSKQDIIGDLDAIRNHAEVGYLKPVPVQSDWLAESGLAYILNKPDLSIYLTSETQSNWDESDITSAAYILNKPDLTHFLTIETNPNWNETNSSSAAYIQNKPDLSIYLTSETQSDWNVSDSTSYAYILNKPDLSIYLTSETIANWNETDSTSAAYIQNKPTIPVVSTMVTENDTNPVSGGAVYAKFEDLIGTAPAALDTLGEIAAALNNNADLASTLTNQITAKIPKVSNPTTGNFAYFNSDGTIADSSYNYNTFLTEHQLLKTINNESLVGTGNIVISGLPQVSASDNGKILMVVNGQWQLVSPSVLYSGSGVPNNANGNNGDLYMQTE